jgi:hypothetical protein
LFLEIWQGGFVYNLYKSEIDEVAVVILLNRRDLEENRSFCGLWFFIFSHG